MNLKRWTFTIISFAAVLGVSAWYIVRWWRAGSGVSLPLIAHVLAAAAVITEIVTRSLKISFSGRAVQVPLSFWTAVRTTLGGDFGASITPARSGAEPARFLVLSEAGVPTAGALVVLYAELFLEALSLATIVIIVAFVFRHAGVVLGALVGVVGGYSALVIGVGVLAVVLARRPATDVPPRWAMRLRLHGKRWARVQRSFAQIRNTVAMIQNVDYRWAFASYFMSVIHLAMKLCVLPALVLGAGAKVPLAPLALWPMGLLYGTALVPAPGGGGTVELAFRAALAPVIGPKLFAAALLWWRFYTFYIYILLGGVVAGRVVIRAIKNRQDKQHDPLLELPEI